MTTLAKYLSPLFLSPQDSGSLSAPPMGNEGSLLSLPPLRKDMPNIVQMYYGSFNPPHIGHLAVLRAVLENTKDWNVVGVLVWCMSDQWLEKKLEGRTLILSQQQRAALWRNDPRLPATVWVVEEALFCTDDPGAIWDWVVEAAEWDGFEIRWVDIMGPDRHMHGRWEGIRLPVMGRGLVVCDAARECGYLDEAGVPRQGKVDSEWTRIKVTAWQETVKESDLTLKLTTKALESPDTAGPGLAEAVSTAPSSSSNSECYSESRFGSIAESSTVTTPGKSDLFSLPMTVKEAPTVSAGESPKLESAAAASTSVWECYNLKQPQRGTRLICQVGRKRVDSTDSLAEMVSSTTIRKLVQSGEWSHQQDHLDSLVLSPKLFKEFVRECEKGWTTPQTGFPASRDESLDVKIKSSQDQSSDHNGKDDWDYDDHDPEHDTAG